MAPAHLLSLTPELMLRILQACVNFSDLVALASSCKQIHEAWVTHAPSLLWKLAPTKILAFNAALMAVSLVNHTIQGYLLTEDAGSCHRYRRRGPAQGN